MPKLPRVTAAETIRVLEKIGFVLDRQKGSHRIYYHPNGSRAVVPVHAGKILSPKVLKDILRSAGLSVEEFVRLLKDP
jgi:predicted RNA binding protein YcfA (HicA-like mRNA interferase family)